MTGPRPAFTIVFLIFVLSFGCSVRAAFEQKGAGSLFYGTGSAGIASADSIFFVFTNPAKAAALHKARMDFMMRNLFQLGSLNQAALNSAFRIGALPVAFGISRYGNSLYAETESRFVLAYEIAESFYLGAGLNGYWLTVKNYGQAFCAGITLAGYYRLLPAAGVAFVAQNLNEPKIGAAGEKLPLNMTLGFSYRLFNKLELNLDIVKDNLFDFEYRFGVRYRLNRWLGFMSGFREQVNTFGGGFFIIKKHLLFSYALELHQVLGYNHSLTLGYTF